MTLKSGVSVEQMVREAEAEIEILDVQQALVLHGRDDVVFVDIRDIRELEREGRIPGAWHVPRGMLEFWLDPASPYHKARFAEDRRFVFHCAKGWRSVLATHTAQRMGLQQVCHFDGGFDAWKAAGGPVEDYQRKP